MQAAANLPAIWNISFRGSSSKFHIVNPRHRKSHALHCLRSEGHEEFDNSQENLGLSSITKEAKHKDIWNLFKKAQKNILILNKQRLAAVEELEKLKNEKDELLERINQLEAESQFVIKKDKSSLFWELLLRIDSMVINGLINIEEASSMRKLVKEHEANISEFPFDVLQRGDAEILAELRRFTNKGKRNGLHVIHICTEMAPLVFVGPLASYITGLSCALQEEGYMVEVILPKYSTLDLDEIEGLREIEADAYSYFNGQLHANRIWNGVISGIGVTLIQPVYYSSMFSRDKVYGYQDDFDRFAYFSRASLDYIAKSGKQPDVLHIHNWQTAIVGPLFWDIFVNQGLEGTRILLTCQDFDKGLVPPEKLELCGLDPAELHRLDRLQDNVNPHFVNILKGGVVYSNKVVIMSSSHSSVPGLEPTLAIHNQERSKTRVLKLYLTARDREIMTKVGQRDSPAKEEASTTTTTATKKRFLTPGRFVTILCIVNLINYVDRGVIASNGVNGSSKTCDAKGVCSAGTGIQGEFNLTNFEDGLLSSAFMVGLLVASPIFAGLSKRVNPFKLIGVGLTVWTIAALGCGFSYNFWMIAVFRMFVGVGEASFISLAAPYIDDSAPVERKNFWLGLFYMCIPAGVALGYVFGGYVGNHLGWRWAFYIEAIAMAVFVVLSFCIKPPQQLKGFADKDSKKLSTSIKTKTPKSKNLFVVFGKDLKALFCEKVFIVNVLGYITYNFVIGAYSYWGPKAGFGIYQMKNADMIFGGLTIICGIIGTLGGSYVLDRITATLPNTFKLLAASTLLGAAFCFTAFSMKNMYAFIGLFALGEILIFAPQAPVNYVCLHCVRPNLRPLSMASSTVLIHILGDVPSSPLYGKMQDHFKNWRTSTLIITSILFVAAIIWGIGIFMNSVDRSNEVSEDDEVVEEKLESKADNSPLV